MRYKIPKKNLFVKNRNKLTSQFFDNSVAILHSNDEMPRNGDQTYPFRQNSDLFYLTGLDQPKCILMLCPNHPDKKKREMIFTEETNEKIATWEGHRYTKDEVTQISGIERVHWLDEFETQLRDCMIRFDNVYLNQNEYLKFETAVPVKQERFIKELKEKYPLHKYHRVAPLLKNSRVVKEKEEIEMMKKAAKITGKGFERVLRNLNPGVMEYQMEAELTYEFMRNGAAGHAYPPIVASGDNACVLHYIDNEAACKKGDLLLMDFGAEYGNYASDVSRTIPVNGTYTDRQRECYEAVLQVQKKAIDLLIPGKNLKDINKEVGKMMEEAMIEIGLFTRKETEKQDDEHPLYKKYFMHGVSHYIGLDVHDVGDMDGKLKKGMVLTCEPGLYIREEGIGIRIEDDIMVAEKPVNLTYGIPKEIGEIEQAMKR